MSGQFVCVDLHVHTALSTCASNDMKPNELVKHALASHLDVIAVTDHNSTANIEAVVKAARGTELLIIPGMEVETREEVHILTLFSDLETALRWGIIVQAALPNVTNSIDHFGRQIVFTGNKEEEYQRLLLQSTTLSLAEVVDQVHSMGGVCIPAHIDRSSYSIINTLGFIPPELGLSLVEFSRTAGNLMLQGYITVVSSDAHYLHDLYGKPSTAVQVSDKSIKEVFSVLQGRQSSKVVIF